MPSGLSFARFDAFGIYTRLTATGCHDEMDWCTRTATSSLAVEVNASSPSIPAVLRPALRCVTRRTLTSVLDRLRSISFCRFLTFGQSCSCAALKIRCRSRRTSPSQDCQSMAAQPGTAPSGPFTITASTVVSDSMASNLPFGSGGLGRMASKAHLPTSAPSRVRAAARYPAGYPGRPAEGWPCCPGFPLPYGTPALASWASCSRQGLRPSLPPAYRHHLTAPDPGGVSTFRMRELRPGWAPPLPRGQRCSRSRRRFARLPLAVPPRPGPAPRSCIHLPEPWVTRHHQGFTHVRPSGLPLARASRMERDTLGLLP